MRARDLTLTSRSATSPASLSGSASASGASGGSSFNRIASGEKWNDRSLRDFGMIFNAAAKRHIARTHTHKHAHLYTHTHTHTHTHSLTHSLTHTHTR